MKQHFVFFTAVLYDSCLGGRSVHLAEMLAAQGHQVTFVDMPGTRAALSHACRFSTQPTAGNRVRVMRLVPLPAYLRLYPSMVTRSWIGYTSRTLQRRIPDLAKAIVVVSTPWWVPIVQTLPHALLCYDYIDHVSVHTSAPHHERFLAWDATLLSTSTMITTVSATLQRDIVSRVATDRVFLIPNGVKRDWLALPSISVPRDMLSQHPQQPIVGFLGALFEWVDIPLLVHAAQALPHVQFVLVGPTRPGIRLHALQALPNVRCFGSQPHSEVPRWISAFDICLIPFKQDIIAAAADPIKLYEYSALGKSIVSTVSFDGVTQELPIFVARSSEEFVAAIKQAIATDSPLHKAERRAFAKHHTWEQRAADFIAATNCVLAH